MDQTLFASTLWIKHCLPPHRGSKTVCIHTVDQTLFASTPWIKHCLHPHRGSKTVCIHTVDQTLFASTLWIKHGLPPDTGLGSKFMETWMIFLCLRTPIPTYSYTYVLLLYLRTPPIPTYFKGRLFQSHRAAGANPARLQRQQQQRCQQASVHRFDQRPPGRGTCHQHGRGCPIQLRHKRRTPEREASCAQLRAAAGLHDLQCAARAAGGCVYPAVFVVSVEG